MNRLKKSQMGYILWILCYLGAVFIVNCETPLYLVESIPVIFMACVVYFIYLAWREVSPVPKWLRMTIALAIVTLLTLSLVFAVFDVMDSDSCATLISDRVLPSSMPTLTMAVALITAGAIIERQKQLPKHFVDVALTLLALGVVLFMSYWSNR